MIKHFESNWKRKDLEIRTMLIDDEEGSRPHIELIKWKRDEWGRHFCHVGIMNKTNDGEWIMRFVGDGAFDDEVMANISQAWKQLFLARKKFEESEARGEEK